MVYTRNIMASYNPKVSARVTCPYCSFAVVINKGLSKEYHQSIGEHKIEAHIKDVHKYRK